MFSISSYRIVLLLVSIYDIVIMYSTNAIRPFWKMKFNISDSQMGATMYIGVCNKGLCFPMPPKWLLILLLSF